MSSFARPIVIILIVLLTGTSGPAEAFHASLKISETLSRETGKITRSFLSEAQSSNLLSYSIDLGVWRKREDALQHIAEMKRNHPVLKKYKFYLKQLDFNHWGTGIVHRIRIGYMKTQKEADIVCGNLLEDGYQKKCQTQFDPG
ncbi:MAG: hypothetical protein ACRBBN_19155 [Methyloligellaceae bacterium]